MKKQNRFLALILVISLLITVSAAFATSLSSAGTTPEQPALKYNIVISEICSKNESIIADNDGKYRDYIELYNPGEPVDLTGFSFTNGRRTSDPISNIILQTGEYRIFFFDNDLNGFSVGSSGGDSLQLLDPHRNIIAQTNTAPCNYDEVMLYQNGVYKVSSDASPGFPNSQDGLSAFRNGRESNDPALVISEIFLNNISAFPDENGLFSDIVELHNVSGNTLNLGQYFLSDSTGNRFRYRLPDIFLPTDAYLVIFCDGENYIGTGNRIHSNFALSHGETLVLSDNLGNFTSADALSVGQDLSRSLDSSGEYTVSPVSLGYPNTEDGQLLFVESVMDRAAPLVISEVLLSSAETPYNGSVQDAVEIMNRSGETVNTSGWYLSDGNDPYAYPLQDTTLSPGERIVIPCSVQSTGFSLSVGESVLLLGPSHLYASVVPCASPDPGMSISLLEGSSDIGYTLMDITLGFENTQSGHAQYRRDQLPEDLIISELMSANLSYLKGSYATTSDWVELYNNSDRTISLADYALSNDADNPGKYPLPDITLGAGEYCLIFLNKDPRNLLNGYEVLPFSLSSQGDQLYLSQNSVITDYVFIPSLPTDYSYGRSPEHSVFALQAKATPNGSNSEQVQMSAAPVAETPQGSYDDVDFVEVFLSAPGNIYYTTDCTKPTTNSNLYTEPLRLTSTTVLRVMCQEPGKLPSEVNDFTYLINENTVLPAVSLVLEPRDLWGSSTGIYIAGPGYSKEPPHYGSNYWKDWEKQATISLFENDGSGFSANCGIKIFGAYTRALQKKSLAVFFRDCYGDSELSYPVFGENSLDTYESIILRTSGQDAFRGRMRDVVLTSLLGEATDVPVQQYKPVVLFLNGEYWGLHYIREKLNENYVAGHYNVSADTVTIAEQSGWTSKDYRALVSYVLNNNMAEPEHYEYVCSQIDVDNYIDMYIAQIWITNTDNGNVKFFRIGDDGKWTWFFYDTDLSLSDYDRNSVLSNLTTAGLTSSDYIGRVFAARMLRNKDFRDKFLSRMAWQMNNIWTKEKVLGRIAELESIIAPIMVRECERWNVPYRDWEYSLKVMRTFVEKRNGYVLKHVQNYFQLTDAEMRAYGFTK